MRSSRTAVAVVLGVMLFSALVRLRLADMPLERDEGEYAYAGRLILDGVPPYRLAYNMKLPGTYYAYAAIMSVLGESTWGIHVGLALVNAATTWLVFALARRLLGDVGAVVAAVAFSLLTLDRWVMGVVGHATHFVTLPTVAGLLLLLRGMETSRRIELLGAGALLGTAVVMKQHAALFVALGIWIVLADAGLGPRVPVRDRIGRSALVVAGAALPLVLVVAAAVAQGVFGRFWLWTVEYAAKYASAMPVSDAPRELARGFATITRATLPFWIFAACGGVTLWATKWDTRRRTFLTAFLVASFLVVCPGFYFRTHYFIVLLPAAALLAGVAVVAAERALVRATSPWAAQAVACGIFAACAVATVLKEREFLFSTPPRDVVAKLYRGNPFVEAPEIAKYIHERSGGEDRIAVLGSEPEIYFYSDRRGATGYIYTYALMEGGALATRMQEEMIREVEAARPLYIVDVEIFPSWATGTQSDQRIFDWAEKFVRDGYELVGVVDKPTPEESVMLWDADARAYQPRSENLVRTYRRRD